MASGASGVLKMLSRLIPVDTKPGTFFFEALVWNWFQVDFLTSCTFSILWCKAGGGGWEATGGVMN